MSPKEIEQYASEHGMTVEHVKAMQKTIAESLNRHFGKPTMSDKQFETTTKEFVDGVEPIPDTLANNLEGLQYAWKHLNVGLLTIMPLIDKPYPDDPRWTPYTFVLERYVKMLEYYIPKVVEQAAKETKS